MSRPEAAQTFAGTSGPWPFKQVEAIQDLAQKAAYQMGGMDVLGTLTCLAAIADQMAEAAADVLDIAATETKIPQTQLADALGVPAHTLRGLRQKR